MSSFPVPLSPSMRTGNGAAAARVTWARTCAIARLPPDKPRSSGAHAGGLAVSSSTSTSASSDEVAAAASSAIARLTSTMASAGQRQAMTPSGAPYRLIGTAASTAQSTRSNGMAVPVAKALPAAIAEGR